MKILVASIIFLLTVAGAYALIAGPFTKEQAAGALQDPVFYNELGFMLAEQGDMEAAQKAFATAVALGPQYERARYNLATTAFKNEDYETAIEHLRVLVKSNPSQNYKFDLAQNLVHQARYVDADPVKLAEAAEIFESLGNFPHARENARIVRAVIAENF